MTDDTEPAPGVVIRLARPSDLRRIAPIEDSGAPMFREYFGNAVVPALLAPAPSGAARDGSGTLLVAAVGRTLVGFAHLLFIDGYAHLNQLSVLPEYGRRGIGGALVRAAMEEARWAGYDRMSLCTYRDVPWNGPFYARLGFTEATRLEPYLVDLRRHEQGLGLDDPAPRCVMTVRLQRRSAT